MQDTPYNGVATEEGAKLTVAPALCAGQEDTPYNGVATEEGAKLTVAPALCAGQGRHAAQRRGYRRRRCAKAPCSPGAVRRAGRAGGVFVWKMQAEFGFLAGKIFSKK